jgi:hypothetical protein
MTTAVAIIGAGLSFASEAFSAVSQYQAASYQAKIAEYNQQIANDNAKRTLQTAQVQQQDQDAQSLALLGEQEANQAASGFSLGSRSFRLARRSAQELARKDALNIRQAGEVEAYNYRVQANNFGLESELAKMQANSSLLGGFLGGATSLISSATKVRKSTMY